MFLLCLCIEFSATVFSVTKDSQVSCNVGLQASAIYPNLVNSHLRPYASYVALSNLTSLSPSSLICKMRIMAISLRLVKIQCNTWSGLGVQSLTLPCSSWVWVRLLSTAQSTTSRSVCTVTILWVFRVMSVTSPFLWFLTLNISLFKVLPIDMVPFIFLRLQLLIKLRDRLLIIREGKRESEQCSDSLESIPFPERGLVILWLLHIMLC